ncbi:MAG: DUF1499 domain-containing protein [Gammaproteobacteria bacterium]
MRGLLLSGFILALAGCGGQPPTNIGVHNGRLAPCPESPNCVSSFSETEQHGIAPLSADLVAIAAILLSLPEANIVSAGDNYLYAEFTSRIMRYVDDVEFLYDPVTGITQVRSASRLGYSDMGANRNRIEFLRAALP